MQFAKPLLAAFALGIMVALPAHAELDVASLKQSIEASFEREYPKLDALYKDIHAHPEIAFQEEKTAAKLAAEMRAIGFEVTEKVGKTGLVALYKNGDGPTIMVRTELDALPMEEKTGLPYASRDKTIWQGRETFVAHSCGHDIHMTSWVGAAKTLVGLKDQWKGTLMFIAQPAEEVAAGARAMLADGLFTRFPKPDAGFALHDGAFPYGYVNYRVGVGSSNADGLYIKFTGRGGHGAVPQETVDPVMMASRFVVDVQSVISREKDPTEFGVVSIGSLHAGTAGNIIPDEAVLLGTIRTFKPDDAREDARWNRTYRQSGRRHGECACTGYQDRRRYQGGGQRCRCCGDRREGAEGGVRRQIHSHAAAHPERGFFRVHQCRRAVDVLQYRCLRSRARRSRAQWRPPASRQPFPDVRAGAEADHPDRRHRDDARSAERIRPEGQGAVTARPSLRAKRRQRPDRDLRSGCGTSRPSRPEPWQRTRRSVERSDSGRWNPPGAKGRHPPRLCENAG